MKGSSQSSISKLESTRIIKAKEILFIELEKDYKDIKVNIEEQVSIVYNFGDSKSERVPWLEITVFLYYIARLKDEEIQGLYKLSPKKELDQNTQDILDLNLVRILVAAESILRDTY